MIIHQQKPQQCDLCGKIAELCPYGPHGECVCFECGMQNEEAAKQAFRVRMETEQATRDETPEPEPDHSDIVDETR